MATKKRKKKYTFKPNKNTLIVLVGLILLIWCISGIRSCTKYDRSLRGAPYAEELVNLPEFQVRACARPDGTPTADYQEIYPGKVGDKVMYLTFDDGPSKKVTPQVLDILKKYNVKATFFIVAKNAEQYPDLLKRIAQEGHAIASHSYSHEFDTLYADTESFRSEIFAAKESLINIVGEEHFTDIFRFPGGAFSGQREEFKEVLIQENVPYVNWNCLTGDAETRNPVPADLIAKAKKTAGTANSDSLILLMHDAGAKQASADALPGIIEAFQKDGYRFDTLKRK
ncbi:MAG: polysaccharide deacetylase [Clostridia bacterium]|nr:polysaccharide deacetylase [Clostridia bacterium]